MLSILNLIYINILHAFTINALTEEKIGKDGRKLKGWVETSEEGRGSKKSKQERRGNKKEQKR